MIEPRRLAPSLPVRHHHPLVGRPLAVNIRRCLKSGRKIGMTGENQQPASLTATALPPVRNEVWYTDGVVVLRKSALDIGIYAPCAVCLFFKLDQYQEILMSISTTKIQSKNESACKPCKLCLRRGVAAEGLRK
jgi:hypothetical protein